VKASGAVAPLLPSSFHPARGCVAHLLGCHAGRHQHALVEHARGNNSLPSIDAQRQTALLSSSGGAEADRADSEGEQRERNQRSNNQRSACFLLRSLQSPQRGGSRARREHRGVGGSKTRKMNATGQTPEGKQHHQNAKYEKKKRAQLTCPHLVAPCRGPAGSRHCGKSSIEARYGLPAKSAKRVRRETRNREEEARRGPCCPWPKRLRRVSDFFFFDFPRRGTRTGCLTSDARTTAALAEDSGHRLANTGVCHSPHCDG
jgi:hypothetical protein